jgi:ribosome maturation factor RimP
MRIEEIENLIEPVVISHGCELWGIELLRGKKDLQLESILMPLRVPP